MASTDILAGIAALTPTYDSDITIHVHGVENLTSNVLPDSKYPLRMIGLPETPTTNEVWAFVLIGKGGYQEYNILDRLYLNPTTIGVDSLNENAVLLYRYIDSYREQIRSNRGIFTSATILGVQFTRGWRYWPDNESGVPFYTVDALVQVREHQAC